MVDKSKSIFFFQIKGLRA